MEKQPQPQVDPDAVAAMIAAHTTSAAPVQASEASSDNPGPREVQLDPGMAPVVEELKAAAPTGVRFEPEPNLAFMPAYPAVLQDGGMKKYGEALQAAELTRPQKEEYLRALLANGTSHLDACHRWDIPLVKGKLIINVRSINGYEETLIEQVVRAQISKKGDALLPATLRNTEICCSIVLQICTYDGRMPWRNLSFDPARAADPAANLADQQALEDAAGQLMLSTTPAQRKACVSALQMFEAMTMKCQVGVFDESF